MTLELPDEFKQIAANQYEVTFDTYDKILAEQLPTFDEGTLALHLKMFLAAAGVAHNFVKDSVRVFVSANGAAYTIRMAYTTT